MKIKSKIKEKRNRKVLIKSKTPVEADNSNIPKLTDKQLEEKILCGTTPALLKEYQAEFERRQKAKEVDASRALVIVGIITLAVSIVFTMSQIELQKQINIEQAQFNGKILNAFDKLANIQEQAQYKSWKTFTYFEDSDQINNTINAGWNSAENHLELFGRVAVHNIGTMPIILDYFGELHLNLNCDNEKEERPYNASLVTDRNTPVLLTGESNRYSFYFTKAYENKPKNCILTARTQARHPIDNGLPYQDTNVTVVVNG